MLNSNQTHLSIIILSALVLGIKIYSTEAEIIEYTCNMSWTFVFFGWGVGEDWIEFSNVWSIVVSILFLIEFECDTSNVTYLNFKYINYLKSGSEAYYYKFLNFNTTFPYYKLSLVISVIYVILVTSMPLTWWKEYINQNMHINWRKQQKISNQNFTKLI